MEANHVVTLDQLGITAAHLPADTNLSFRRESYRIGPMPNVSFIVPVHNMGQFVYRNLVLLSQHAREEHEFVIILDDCEDNSASEVSRAIHEMVKSRVFLGATVVTSRQSLFETVSDKIGICLASGRVIIEVQSDMQLRESGFDSRLVAALEKNPDIFALSGRGCHDWEFWEGERKSVVGRFRHFFALWLQRVYSRKQRTVLSKFVFHNVNYFGRCGKSIEHPGFTADTIFLAETVMRGPLAFDRSRYFALGGFDSRRFFLGDDDHDLTYRAWVLRKWRSGYLPVDFESPLLHGATRREKTKSELEEFSRVASHYSATEVIKPDGPMVRPGRATRRLSFSPSDGARQKSLHLRGQPRHGRFKLRRNFESPDA